MGAAEDFPAGFNAVSDNFAAAVLALRRHHRDRALEAVERMHPAVLRQLEGFIVVVAAEFTFSHRLSSAIVTDSCVGPEHAQFLRDDLLHPRVGFVQGSFENVRLIRSIDVPVHFAFFL
jgi:hypothetical protein